MKSICLIIIMLVGIFMTIFAVNPNSPTFAQGNSLAKYNVAETKPFILFAQVWGGDFPITQTFVYDSFSNKSVGVLGNDVSINKPLPEQIAEIKGDIQTSGIQSIKSDKGSCNLTQICYLLHVVVTLGFTNQVESHWVTWNSNSNQTYYENLNNIMSKIQKFGY